ncbi:Sedlin [Penicillium malachiteum]|nr:Sedlin [Penicillium malachiteum]
MAGPRIACIGVIGKADNPLHISLFPPYTESKIEFSFLLNSCLDIFDIRRKQTSIDQELGLLQAIDERIAAYGWLTTTGVKFLIIVDLFGPETSSTRLAGPAVSGLNDSDLKPAFRALQTAYIQLLQNPFYSPDLHAPALGTTAEPASSCQPISNPRFIAEVKRIGATWTSGATF